MVFCRYRFVDPACRRDGPGTRKIASRVGLDRGLRRATGTAGATDSMVRVMAAICMGDFNDNDANSFWAAPACRPASISG